MMRERIDCHVHVLDGDLEHVRLLARKQKEYGYTGSNFLSVEGMNDAAQNAMAIYFKTLDPNHYAFGSMHYRFSYDFAWELERLHEIGFDGIKMIENKPTERKLLGYAQDDTRYDAMYARAEQLDMPFLIHVNDPRNFWNPETAPRWAVDAGYAYTDGSYVSFDQILGESIRMMEKHPKLRVCFAHFLFLSDDEEKLRELMERFPGLSLDITAGTEMYYNFTEKRERWRQFFLDYANRIMYGTDNCNRMDAHEQEIGDIINRLQIRFLTETKQFPLWDGIIHGIGLPQELLARIMSDNFKQFTSAMPRKINRTAAREYLSERLTNSAYRLTDRERGLVEAVQLCL